MSQDPQMLQVPMTPEMIKAEIKQACIKEARDFTNFMAAEKLNSAELKLTGPNDFMMGARVAQLIVEMEALGNKLKGMYGYMNGTAIKTQDGPLPLKDVCMVWEKDAGRSLIV